MVDGWLGLDVALRASKPTGFWAFPVEAVSQSEGGFEAVHQSVCVMPHWLVEPDKKGRWSITMHLAVDATHTENHAHHPAAAATTP
jgi:alpha-amylase